MAGGNRFSTWKVAIGVFALFVLALQGGSFHRLGLAASLSLSRLSAADATTVFQHADADGDSKLSNAEFLAALTELGAPVSLDAPTPPLAAATPSSGPRRKSSCCPPMPGCACDPSQAERLGMRISNPTVATGSSAAAAAAAMPNGNMSMPLNPPVTGRGNRMEGLPQCSLVFFLHIIKTGGTTMRTVLQRQAQLGDFEYIYCDTVKKPRWQLILHQLTQKAEKRRTIIELHSEWGLGRTFYADVKALRAIYEPLGCRVTLATMLRNPVAHQLSWYNWRASNHVPFCQWEPPYDALSRQICGYGLPFTMPKDRRMRIPPPSALSAIEQYDIVGTMERFDESLVLLADAAGFRHYPYAKLAENNKPKHPKFSKRVLQSMLADAGLKSQSQSFESDTVAWSKATIEATLDYNKITEEFVVRVQKADCNFYPCAEPLMAAKGLYNREMCASASPAAWVDGMLNRTATDRAVYKAVGLKLEAQLQAMALRGVPMAARLEELSEGVADVLKRRNAQISAARGFCGVQLCGSRLRSCVACEPNVVPGMESCWPSWEDQFTPDEQKLWCKRTWTINGYDAAELKARTYPKVSPIPCWQTCWEVMEPDRAANFSTAPSCLLEGAPNPAGDGKPGSGCANRRVHCSPGCAASGPTHSSLELFWKDWKRLHQGPAQLDALKIGPPHGPGG